ncbi:MAG: molybdopterin-binding protein, partial [Hyphomicrobiales bacterium]|nr:molybdopterin-binding protein [Hyphomicrobiales bacterium]
DAVNAIDDALTLATLPAGKRVAAGEMAATVKVIPFAAPREALLAAVAAAAGALSVAAFLPLSVGVVSTLLPGLKPSVVEKTLRAIEGRLAPTGARVARETRVAHATGEIARAVRETAAACDVTVVFGASAIVDGRDAVPEAIRRAGGRIVHFGAPVDPGNLLLLAEVAGKPVIGAPGCARSPRENAFDWALDRALVGDPMSARDVRKLGVGGLLTEIGARGLARTKADAP